MEALGTLAARLTGLLVSLAAPLGLLWLGWGTLKALLTGGTDRALTTLLMRGLIVGVLVAILGNLPATFGVFTSLGDAILQTVLQAFQGAV